MEERPRRWMDDPEQPNVGRHRTRALTNGLVVGMGIALLLSPSGLNPFGVVLIALGLGVEYWHRQRLKRGGP